MSASNAPTAAASAAPSAADASESGAPTAPSAPRLLVVSNRLPFTVKLVKTNVAPAGAAAKTRTASQANAAADSTVPFSPPADATSMPPGATTPFAAAALAQSAIVAPFPSSSPPPGSSAGVTTEVLISPSPGGLVSALRGVDRSMTWIGWPGLVSDTLSSHERQLIRDKFKEHECLPVFLGAKLFDL